MWFRGEVLLPSSTLPLFPDVPNVSLVEASVGWLLCECRELEGTLKRRVLEALGLDFPSPHEV
jgi:hypothetical protein